MSLVETRFPTALPARAHRWGCLNQKGGVGKTALTVGTAGALAERGRRVLLLDLDPQGHLTTEALGLSEVEPGQPTLAQLLTREWDGHIGDLIVGHSHHASGGRIDLIPTSPEMFLAVSAMYKGRGRRLEWVLDDHLNTLDPHTYDYIGIDCPPALDILTDNFLVTADSVLIPIQVAKTSLRALSLLLDQVAVLEQELLLPPRTLLGLVPSLYKRPLSGYADWAYRQITHFADHNSIPVLAHLPLAVAVEEAWLQGRTIVDYVPKGPHADAHRRVALRLEIAAGHAHPTDWDHLEPLPRLAAPQRTPKHHTPTTGTAAAAAGPAQE